MTNSKRVGLLSLVAVTFFMVSGGAYGLEELVGCGYGVAVAAIVVTPVVWSLPTALMVGELASTLPHEGGYYAWVRRAMGPFWGFQEAWLSLVASIFDMAIYPTLVALYVGRLVPWAAHGVGAAAVGAAMIAFCAAWNMRGAATVGAGSMILGIAMLAPFAAIGALGLLEGHGAQKGGAPTASAGPSVVLTGVLVAMWNYMGWDNTSTIAQEVDRPAKTYPRAVLGALALVVLAYLWPIAGAAAGGVDPHGWTTGAWVGAAHDVGGPWLAAAVVLGGIVSGFGTYNALLLSYSRLPSALSTDGYLPAWLSHRDARTGTPWASVVACSFAYAACLGIGFARLVALDILLYGASLALEFAALVVLRVREPDLERPFKLPGGTVAAVLWSVPPLSLLGVALWHCAREPSPEGSSIGPLALSAILVALGPALYALRRRPARDAATGAEKLLQSHEPRP